MRIALVSPYSYTYPGGVGRHVEALTEELLALGHDARLLAPYDPDDARARAMHRGARPQARAMPDYLIPVGRTIGIPANGAVSNLAPSPAAVAAVGRELRGGGYDVVHVHEPNAPVVSWYAAEAAPGPLVGTFHTYSKSAAVGTVAGQIVGARRLYNRLHVRIAVSEAARWTAERFYGGRYRVIPNGVDLAASLPKAPHSDRFEVLFVGRAEERKGLPVLLRAFEALREVGVEARLTVAGATREEVDPYLLDAEGVRVLGPVADAEKWELLSHTDVLCAPSLGGESFGMVLTEAFAAHTPVVCSDIAGYRDVARDGVDGLLVPPGRPAELGEALHALAIDRGRRERMAAAARDRAERFAWPTVASEVAGAYADAQETAAAQPRVRRHAARIGIPAPRPERSPRPRRLPPLDAVEPGSGRRRVGRALRRGSIAVAALAAVGLTGLALSRIGLDQIVGALLDATPVWVLLAFALMCGSMLMRAEAWHAVLEAALPAARVRRRDTARATMIGVLMSATLPARLGEPSRAVIVARRIGRVRERLPVVLGTLVSQTLLNILALVILGAIMFATVGLFKGNEDALLIAAVAPVVLLALVLAAPLAFGRRRIERGSRGARRLATTIRDAMVQVRSGLGVFRHPRLGAWAAVVQLAAWGVQLLSCYLLLVALGLDERAGIGAAAAVLFAVNVTAVLPALPSNLGVFQAVCVAVLTAYGVGKTDALAYGIVLQAVEIATALAMGMPALLREGMSWKDMRLRALHASPVELAVTARRREPAEA